MTGWEDAEPVLNCTRHAVAFLRGANSDAKRAPRGDVENVYARAGAVYELLSNAEQLVRVLSVHAQRLADVQGLRSTEPDDPARAVSSAGMALTMAAGRIDEACGLVNDAWSELSVLYINDVADALADQEGGDGVIGPG